MSKQTNQQQDQLERERQELIHRGNQKMSQELKDAVDLAYKLSIKKPPNVEVKTLTSGSC